MEKEIELYFNEEELMKDIDESVRNILCRYFIDGWSMAEIAEADLVPAIKIKRTVQKYLFFLKRKNGDYEIMKAEKILYPFRNDCQREDVRII